MAESFSPSSSLLDSSPSSCSPPTGAVPVGVPNAKQARDPQGHFTLPFKLAALRYAAASGKSQRAAAIDLGISDKTLSAWINDARPNADGIIDAARFDELAQLRNQNRELLARNLRLTAERDFLKKCASYFATPTSGGSR